MPLQKKSLLKERLKAAAIAVEQIKERFGEGAIMTLSEAKKVAVDTIPTGSISLDLALGVGGVPRGRVMEIFGPESSGKTTLALHVIAEAQERDGVAAFVDAEHALDPGYAGRIGVKMDELLISQPDTGEQALEIVETLIQSNAVDVVVIDSVAALTPRAEIEGEMGEAHMGLQARLMSQALRKITAAVARSNTTVIFLNQIRINIGVMFGNPEVTTGGKALKFYSSVRLEIRRRAQIKQGERIVGNRTIVKVVKNKVAPPFQSAEFDILYNEGISWEGDLVDTGVRLGILLKSGSWVTYNGEQVAQGREQAKQYLREHPEVAKDIAEAIRVTAASQEEQAVSVSSVGREEASA
jgi:recombination protein RecA